MIFKKLRIKYLCLKYHINNYTINNDGSIDVDGNVYLYYRSLTKLPLKFRNVNGIFDCSYNKLTSFEGFPKSISGNFYCKGNNIRDFIGFIEPNGNLICDDNPIYNIWKLFGNKEYIELLNDYDCIRGNDIVIDRLNMFLEEIGQQSWSSLLAVKNVKGYNNI